MGARPLGQPGHDVDAGGLDLLGHFKRLVELGPKARLLPRNSRNAAPAAVPLRRGRVDEGHGQASIFERLWPVW